MEKIFGHSHRTGQEKEYKIQTSSIPKEKSHNKAQNEKPHPYTQGIKSTFYSDYKYELSTKNYQTF